MVMMVNGNPLHNEAAWTIVAMEQGAAIISCLKIQKKLHFADID